MKLLLFLALGCLAASALLTGAQADQGDQDEPLNQASEDTQPSGDQAEPGDQAVPGDQGDQAEQADQGNKDTQINGDHIAVDSQDDQSSQPIGYKVSEEDEENRGTQLTEPKDPADLTGDQAPLDSQNSRLAGEQAGQVDQRNQGTQLSEDQVNQVNQPTDEQGSQKDQTDALADDMANHGNQVIQLTEGQTNQANLKDDPKLAVDRVNQNDQNSQPTKDDPSSEGRTKVEEGSGSGKTEEELPKVRSGSGVEGDPELGEPEGEAAGQLESRSFQAAQPQPDAPKETNPDIPAGTNPDIPAGTNPDVTAGTNPDTPAGTNPEIPAGANPDDTAGTNPDIPAGTISDIPAETNPDITAGTNPDTPAGANPDIPAPNNPDIPVGTDPGNTQGTKPESPSVTNSENPPEASAPNPKCAAVRDCVDQKECCLKFNHTGEFCLTIHATDKAASGSGDQNSETAEAESAANHHEAQVSNEKLASGTNSENQKWIDSEKTNPSCTQFCKQLTQNEPPILCGKDFRAPFDSRRLSR